MKTGAKVLGWWAWWPSYGGALVRRFETEEDALEFAPTVGKSAPMGNKWVMRVGYGPLVDDEKYYGFNHDAPIVILEEDVKEQWLKNVEEAARAKAAKKEAKDEA